MDLRGVDVAGVRAELTRFVDETKPMNLSGTGFLITQSGATCGRARAIELSERVRPILEALYPQWQLENPAEENFEFGQIRDAAARLVSRLDSNQEIEALLGGVDSSPRLNAGAMHELVWQAASAQWSTGHRHEAVLAAAKTVNSMLQQKISRRDVSEVPLVREALSEKLPVDRKARLRFPAIEDEQTRDSMRQGVMQFGVGCFQAIRNPVGHLPNTELELSEQVALEQLAAFSLLARWIEQADVDTFTGEPEAGSTGE